MAVDKATMRRMGGLSRDAIDEPTIGVIYRRCKKCKRQTEHTVTEYTDGCETRICHDCDRVTRTRARGR